LYPILCIFSTWNVSIDPKHFFDLVVNDK
jgi:hypothetical protein